jgi:hypothetical protein
MARSLGSYIYALVDLRRVYGLESHGLRVPDHCVHPDCLHAVHVVTGTGTECLRSHRQIDPHCSWVWRLLVEERIGVLVVGACMLIAWFRYCSSKYDLVTLSL